MKQARYPGCEENEVPLRTLSPRAVFVFEAGKRKVKGILIARNAGSVTVEWEDGSTQHCCVDTPVIPTGQVQDAAQWNENQKSNKEVNKMSTAKAKKEKRKSEVPGVTTEMQDAYRKSRTAPSTMTAHDRELVSAKAKLHREYREKKTGAKKVSKRRAPAAKTTQKTAAAFRVRRKK